MATFDIDLRAPSTTFDLVLTTVSAGAALYDPSMKNPIYNTLLRM
jgi:hypothetical protein